MIIQMFPELPPSLVTDGDTVVLGCRWESGDGGRPSVAFSPCSALAVGAGQERWGWATEGCTGGHRRLWGWRPAAGTSGPPSAIRRKTVRKPECLPKTTQKLMSQQHSSLVTSAPKPNGQDGPGQEGPPTSPGRNPRPHLPSGQVAQSLPVSGPRHRPRHRPRPPSLLSGRQGVGWITCLRAPAKPAPPHSPLPGS